MASTRLRTCLRGERGAITTDWAFLVVAGGMMAIGTAAVIVDTTDGFTTTMRGELGAPEPELPLIGRAAVGRGGDRGDDRDGQRGASVETNDDGTTDLTETPGEPDGLPRCGSRGRGKGGQNGRNDHGNCNDNARGL